MISIRLKTAFWVLILVFLAILAQFFVPPISELFKGTLLFLGPMTLFCILGVILIILTLKEQGLPKLRKSFLLLTGASAAGFFVFVFLHNAFYALAEMAKQITFLKYVLEALHVDFFLVATLVCPLAFLVGIVGSIWLFVKKN